MHTKLVSLYPGDTVEVRVGHGKGVERNIHTIAPFEVSERCDLLLAPPVTPLAAAQLADPGAAERAGDAAVEMMPGLSAVRYRIRGRRDGADHWKVLSEVIVSPDDDFTEVWRVHLQSQTVRFERAGWVDVKAERTSQLAWTELNWSSGYQAGADTEREPTAEGWAKIVATVGCPECHAMPGRRCVNNSGDFEATPHRERFRFYVLEGLAL